MDIKTKTARRVENVSKTINASGTTVSVIPFRATGSIYFPKLYGIVTTALGANHTTAFFRLNDQTAQTAITLATGSTLSAFVAGSWLGKTDKATVAVTVKNANIGQFFESGITNEMIFQPFVVVQKNGANTDIEYRYSTTDAPTSGVIQFFCEWEPLSAGSLVVGL